jgi:hypothetical protein
MPTPRSTRTHRADVNPNAGHISPAANPMDRTPAKSGPAGGPNRPEWTTERWKLQVEAEARSRLKRVIRDLGAKRQS